MCAACRAPGNLRTSALGRRHLGPSRPGHDGGFGRVLNRSRFLSPAGQTELVMLCLPGGELLWATEGDLAWERGVGASSRREDRVWSGGNVGRFLFFVFFMEVGCEMVIRRMFPGLGFLPEKATEPPVATSTTPAVVTSSVGCPRFSVSQAVSSGLVPVLVLYRRVVCLVLVERQLDLSSVAARLRGRPV
ncbi:hypothetical protein Taro_018403 [Colocasia esculenta]|uniref:Uncharacterized protein n=1 Tax=Colocasia esculenta TaxID=4460 RepID=A0A843UIM5_COLES|nr:hypothetical protein [Colocasia esculenta]